MARGRRKGRSKPCLVCRRWFVPDVRCRGRQKTCGRAACRAEQKRRKQAAWAAANPGYWAERRLRAQAEELRSAARGPPVRPPPAELAELPADYVQESLGVEGLVIVAHAVRLCWRAAQAEMRSYSPEKQGESPRLGRPSAHAERPP